MAKSQQTIIVPHNLDHSGHWLLVKIFTTGIGIETGVRLIRAGLSFAVIGAPARYTKTNKLGVFSYGAIMEMEALKPWSLKQNLYDIGSESEVVHHRHIMRLETAHMHSLTAVLNPMLTSCLYLLHLLVVLVVQEEERKS